MKEPLTKFILTYINFSDEELAAITSCFKEHCIAADHHLLKKGQLIDNYYFVVTGSLRFYIKQQEEEITEWFAFEHDFFTDLHAYEKQIPSLHYIQAMKDAELLVISKVQMDKLFGMYPKWERFVRLVWQEAFLKVVNGFVNFQFLSAEERYLHLMEHTDLIQKVPLKYLASYLGVTASTLSRIRGNLD